MSEEHKASTNESGQTVFAKLTYRWQRLGTIWQMVAALAAVVVAAPVVIQVIRSCPDTVTVNTLYVYTDAFLQGNQFRARGLIGSNYNSPTPYAVMDEECVDEPHNGSSCIECKFFADGNNWAGFYFLAGVERNGELVEVNGEIEPNWGKHDKRSYNLQGALRLTFWAKGDVGGEKIEFFALGVGRDHRSGEVQDGATFPGSSPRAATGIRSNSVITLTSEWTKYTIELEGKDLSRILGGFGWSTNAYQNNIHDIMFYLDDIQYEFVPYPEE